MKAIRRGRAEEQGDDLFHEALAGGTESLSQDLEQLQGGNNLNLTGLRNP